MRLGDGACEPETDSRRAGAAHAAREGVDAGVDPRPVVGDLHDDAGAVALDDVDRDVRAVAQAVGDEVRDRLTKTCRVHGRRRSAVDANADRVVREARRERADVDPFEPQREELRVGEDPLDVPRGRDGKLHESSTAVRIADRRCRLDERRQRRYGAAQLVHDDREMLGVAHATSADG